MTHPNDPAKPGSEHDLLPELGLKRPATPDGDTPNGTPEEARQDKATRFDGNPNPVPSDSGILGPKDDTPAFLEKKEGVRSGK